MSLDPTIATARSKRDAAKARMFSTLDETKNRLSPSTLAEHAVDGIKDKANTLAADGVAVARERPGAVAAAASAMFLFLIRRPLVGLFKKSDDDAAKANRVKPAREAQPANLTSSASETGGISANSSL